MKSTVRRRMLVGASSLGVAAAALAPAGASAQDAAPSMPESFSAQGAEAAQARTPLPACVDVRHSTDWRQHKVDVTNRCSYGVNWFVDKDGPNFDCRHTPAGGRDRVTWGRQDAYHGTYKCG
ncbi:hypothetical protein FOH10_13190 [Nocardia otitidiscaviarum]|uniref:Uncharacterized protein n=1 Tax=Nocardia otitidiscaviarum TaxID=1823 RepID=A0A516NKT8_9NOCA|nr:hypothetical protein [Nocardia otitidiscaviarum]MCP9618838.1 hypothetical protein [Nocardia otitidiscaviarum]QDP79521.1 hypothetical protein FOH10_13190 [Nocardia otitidiscaviarum]